MGRSKLSRKNGTGKTNGNGINHKNNGCQDKETKPKNNHEEENRRRRYSRKEHPR